AHAPRKPVKHKRIRGKEFLPRDCAQKWVPPKVRKYQRKERPMELYPNIYRTLTAGPVVELRGYAAACRLPGRLYAYLDYNGPTGTARDGLAEGMLALAAQRKVLAPGQTLIEAGSGALAAALALAGRTSGHPVCLAMPDNTPAARQEKLSALGAQLLFSPSREGTAGARALARTWTGKRGWYYTDWLACDDNPEYHSRVTG